MKNLGTVTCAVFELDSEETKNYFEQFSEEGKNGNTITREVAAMSPAARNAFESFFETKLDGVQFLIVSLGVIMFKPQL